MARLKGKTEGGRSFMKTPNSISIVEDDQDEMERSPGLIPNSLGAFIFYPSGKPTS